MTLTFEIFDEVPNDWNNFLLKHDTGVIHNTKEYGLYAPNENDNPKFFRIIDSTGDIKLQVLLLENIQKEIKYKKILSKLTKKFKPLIRWNYGPTTESNDATKIFFKYLQQSKNRIYGITHPLSTIQQNNFNVKEWATYLIDLSDTKENIFSKIDKKSGRKNIERSIERGVTIEEISNNNIMEYLQLYNENKIERGQEETSIEVMENFWKILKPVGMSGYLARKNEKCMGGMLFSYFNGYIHEWGVARSVEDHKNKLYSQDLIKWKIIEWGIQHKMNWYDFSGFNPHPETKKEEGIFRYKKKWGGIKYSEFIFSN